MPLYALELDPNGKPADLISYKVRIRQEKPGQYSDSQLSLLAGGRWREDLRRKDKNAFLVPFSSHVKNWGDYNVNNYTEYQALPLWQGIRQRVLAAANFECAGCPEAATQIHHRDYRPRVLDGSDISPLVLLCRECHKKVHVDEEEYARWEDRETKLRDLVAQKDASFGLNGL